MHSQSPVSTDVQPSTDTDGPENAPIEPASPSSSPDQDEFEPSDFDASSIDSDSTSVNSTVLFHTFKNGRRYHQV